MLSRRSLLVITATLSATAGCRFFRPIDPSAPRSSNQPAPAAAPAPASGQTPVPSSGQVAATGSPTAARQRAGLTDPNIAAMVLASNNTDISYARLAPVRAERADVKEFAQRMLTDHTGVNTMVNQLLIKLDVAPEDNIASLDMRDESAARRDEMRELTGYSFDSTYIENEVSYHQKFLASIDSVMIPAARNPELKALLTAVRPAVAAHLAHAEQVRANVISRK